MKEVFRIVSVALAASLAVFASAQAPSASATIKLLSHSGADYTYDIDLMNTGTTTIGTFWYSWIPGQGYLPSKPISMVSPTDWTAKVTDGPLPSDGYSIQWTTPSSSLLAAGHSLDGFEFTIAADPAEVFGNSVAHAHPLVGTSTVYHATPFSDGGTKFVVTQAVPEPKSTAVLGVGLLGLLVRKRRSRS